MKQIFATIIAIALCAIAAMGQASTEAYTPGVYLTAQGDSLRYRLLTPESVEPSRKYPLVLFMHGAGERGSDNEKQLIHGSQQWLNPVNRLDHPAYVLAPQCPADGYWAYEARPESFVPSEMPIISEPTPIIEGVMALLGNLVAELPIDTDRIYVMGLSMGGMATYDLAVRYPEVFAAAVPICGTVNPIRLEAAKDVAWRIYHGDADPVVPVEGSRQAYRQLRKLGANVTYVEFPGVQHGSWNPAFTDPEFLTWLFSQSKH